MAKKKSVGQNPGSFETALGKPKTLKAATTSSIPAAPAATVKTAAPIAPIAAKADITIDCPVEGEIITGRTYTFRLSAIHPRSVEVSFDGKDWKSCRESVGYWWYDWSGFQAGPYSMAARMTDKNGKVSKAQVRRFTALI